MRNQGLYILSLLLSVSLLCKGQVNIIDSLQNAIDTCSSDKRKISLYHDIAWEYLDVNPQRTKEFALHALELSQQLELVVSEASSYGTLGLYYEVTGDFEQSASNYLKAIKLLEGLEGAEIELANMYHNIAMTFDLTGSRKKAISYYDKALKLQLRFGDDDDLILAYLNLGGVYFEIYEYDSAMFYYHKIIELGKKPENDGYQIVYNNIGNIYKDTEQLDSAEYYYRKTLSYLKRAHNPDYLYSTYVNLSKVFWNRGEFKISQAYADSALAIATDLMNPTYEQIVYETLANLNESKGEFGLALSYYKKFQQLKDSISGADVQSTIAALETRYETAKKENKINELQAQTEIQQTRENFLIISFMLTGLILLILIIFFVNSRRTSRKLAEKNVIIEKSYQEIQDLIRESHHRIKNNLQVVSSLLKLQSKNATSEEARTTLVEAFNRVKTIAVLHQKLQGSQSFKAIPMKEFMEQLGDNINSSMAGIETKVNIDMKIEPMEMDTDQSISVGLIVNELATNSLKYAFDKKEGEIKISMYRKGEEVHLEVSDNGRGFPENFKPESKNSLGFKIVNSLTSKLRGTLRTENKNGALVHIVFPYDRAA